MRTAEPLSLTSEEKAAARRRLEIIIEHAIAMLDELEEDPEIEPQGDDEPACVGSQVVTLNPDFRKPKRMGCR